MGGGALADVFADVVLSFSDVAKRRRFGEFRYCGQSSESSRI